MPGSIEITWRRPCGGSAQGGPIQSLRPIFTGAKKRRQELAQFFSASGRQRSGECGAVAGIVGVVRHHALIIQDGKNLECQIDPRSGVARIVKPGDLAIAGNAISERHQDEVHPIPLPHLQDFRRTQREQVRLGRMPAGIGCVPWNWKRG